MSDTETVVGQAIKEPFMFDEEVYLILETVAFNVLSWVWLLVLMADDFWGFILSCSGMFNRAADTAASYANHLVKRVWDVTVVKGVLPYIISHKDPDYRWGDLHQDLVDAIERVAFSRHVKVPDDSQDPCDVEAPFERGGFAASVPSRGSTRMKRTSYPSLRSYHRASLEGINRHREPLLVEESTSEASDYRRNAKTLDLQRKTDEENEKPPERMEVNRGPEREGAGLRSEPTRKESRRSTTRRPGSAEVFDRGRYEDFKWDPMAPVELKIAEKRYSPDPKDSRGKSADEIFRSVDSSAVMHGKPAASDGDESLNSVFAGRDDFREDRYHPLPTDSRWEVLSESEIPWRKALSQP